MNWISLIISGLTGVMLLEYDILVGDWEFWVIIIPLLIICNVVEEQVKHVMVERKTRNRVKK